MGDEGYLLAHGLDLFLPILRRLLAVDEPYCARYARSAICDEQQAEAWCLPPSSFWHGMSMGSFFSLASLSSSSSLTIAGSTNPACAFYVPRSASREQIAALAGCSYGTPFRLDRES